MALIFAPSSDLIPPALLMSSTAILMAFTHIWPKRAWDPDVGYMTATLTSLGAAARRPRGSAARPAPTPIPKAPFKNRRLLSSVFFMTSSYSGVCSSPNARVEDPPPPHRRQGTAGV